MAAGGHVCLSSVHAYGLTATIKRVNYQLHVKLSDTVETARPKQLQAATKLVLATCIEKSIAQNLYRPVLASTTRFAVPSSSIKLTLIVKLIFHIYLTSMLCINHSQQLLRFSVQHLQLLPPVLKK